jgi:hypothetical protein
MDIKQIVFLTISLIIIITFFLLLFLTISKRKLLGKKGILYFIVFLLIPFLGLSYFTTWYSIFLSNQDIIKKYFLLNIVLTLFLSLFPILICLFRLFYKEKPNNKKFNHNLKSNITDPDKPENFGFKNTWLTVKSDDKIKITEYFNFKETKEANWEHGIHAAYHKNIFITPPIDGWTIILGGFLGELETKQVKMFLSKASKVFDECHLFSTHRVVDYYCWYLFRKGQLIRGYSFAERKTLETIGKKTSAEKEYKLPDTILNNYSDSDWEKLDVPDEDMLMKIAGSWGVSPDKLSGRKDIKGLGLIAKKVNLKIQV